MSNLFGSSSSRTGSSLNVSYKGMPDIVKKLKRLENGGEVAIKRTVSDFASRAPGWVSKGITVHYGVDRAAIKEAAKGSKRGRPTFKVAGIQVANVQLEYKGGLLTPLHFKMTPKSRNPNGLTDKFQKVPGQAVNFKKTPPGQVATVRTPKPYSVEATIIKGKKAKLSSAAYVNVGKKNKEVQLPFQRSGDARLPVEVIRTLSVPQMIDGRARETIEKEINTNLEKRFKNHIKQAMR